MKMKRIVTILSLALSLQGCIFVVGAAAGAAAVAVVYDHRKIQNTLEDTKIANNIVHKMQDTPALQKDGHVNVTVFNRVVLLTGQETSPENRQLVDELAKSVPNVTKVYNQISIQGPTSALTRTSDSWITTKIKSQMLAEENLKSGSIKVVSEDGVVYLMGLVTRAQADNAVNIARQVSGVQSVVKVFQYKD